LWKHYFDLSWRIQQLYEGRWSHVRRYFSWKFLSEKGKKYLYELFEKWDAEHLEIDEDFNDGLEDNVGKEGMQNHEHN